MNAITTEAGALEAVRQDGFALEWMPDALKTVPLCLGAVRQYGMALKFVPEKLKTEELCRDAVRADRNVLRFVPLSMVDEIASEWPAGWDPAAELAWGAWRAATIAGRITLDEARAYGVDQFLPRRDVDGVGDDV